MNKIHKTKYSAASRSWVAVPEIAKSAGKKVGNSNVVEGAASLAPIHLNFKYGVIVLSIISCLGFISIQSYADTGPDPYEIHYFSVKSENGGNFDNDGAKGENSIAVGINAKATGESGVAMGAGAKAYDDQAIAIGQGAYVDYYTGKGISDGIAIGTNARSVQGFNRPTGDPSKDKFLPGSTKGMAIGKNTYANESTVDIGAKSATRVNDASTLLKGSEAAGNNQRASTTIGADSYAAGSFSTVTGAYSNSGGLSSTVTGSLNSVNADKPIASLKDDDIVNRVFEVSVNTVNGTGNTVKKSNGANIFGSGNKITNSRVDQDDAISKGIRDFANITNKGELNKLLNSIELGSVSIMGVNNDITNVTKSVVIGNNSILNGGEKNIIVGFQDKNSDLIGKNITYNQIIGSNVTVAEGTTNSVLLGDEAKVQGSGAVALGASSEANRAALTANANATNTATVANNTVYTLEQATVADKNAISATVKGDLAAVSVGNANATRQITNVAAGSEDTDAVNVAQLKAIANLIGNTGGASATNTPATVVTSGDQNINVQSSGNTYTVSLSRDLTVDSIKAGDTVINNQGIELGDTVINNQGVVINGGASITKVGIDGGGKKISNIAAGDISANSRDAVNGSQLFGLRSEISAVSREASAGTAAAIANGSLAQAYLPGKSMFSASVSNYRGESALAIGVSTISNNGKWILKGSASANSADVGVALTAGYQW